MNKENQTMKNIIIDKINDTYHSIAKIMAKGASLEEARKQVGYPYTGEETHDGDGVPGKGEYLRSPEFMALVLSYKQAAKASGA